MTDSTDYASGRRSVAIDDSSPSPPDTPKLERGGGRPSWARRRQSTGSLLTVEEERRSGQEQLYFQARRTASWALGVYRRMAWWQRVLAIGFIITVNVLGILFLVYNERVLTWLHPKAVAWRETRGGWVLIWLLIVATAFPPMIGYSTMLTVTGFVYGLPNGWFIAASANVVGSTLAFLVSRYYLRAWVERRMGGATQFEALGLVLKHDGIRLLTMVRLCPLPYSLSNGALSTFPTVSPWAFASATALASPKLLIHIFIGGRFDSIGEGGGKMDGTTKAINYASIAGGAILGFVTGYVIWKRTTARARELELEEQTRLEEREAALAHPDSFAEDDDDLNEEEIRALSRGTDDIDFLDVPAEAEPYRDDHGSDNEEARRD